MVNLKNEFEYLIESEGFAGIGRWILWRSYTTELSSYWKPEFNESVGGSQYKFVDMVIKAYSAPSAYGMAGVAEGKTRIAPGDVPANSIMYFTRSEYNVKINDLFFYLDWQGADPPVVVYPPDQADHNNSIVVPGLKSEVLSVAAYHSDVAGVFDFKKIYVEEHNL